MKYEQSTPRLFAQRFPSHELLAVDDLELRGKACDVFLIQGAHNVKFFASFGFKSEPDFNETVWPGRWEGSTSDPIYGFSSLRGTDMENGGFIPTVENESSLWCEGLRRFIEDRDKCIVTDLIIHHMEKRGNIFKFFFHGEVRNIADNGRKRCIEQGKCWFTLHADYLVSKQLEANPMPTVTATEIKKAPPF